MSALPEPILRQILAYLDLPGSSSPPSDPLTLLRLSLSRAPPSLLTAFEGPTSPRDRAGIPEIKARRITWADASLPGVGSISGVGPRTDEQARRRRRALRWRAGRRRWPALWERMGGPGDPIEVRRWEEELGEASSEDEEDEDDQRDEVFAEKSFIPGQETTHHAPAIPVPNGSSSASSSDVPPNTMLAASAAQGSAPLSARSGMNTTMNRRRFGAFLRSLEEERQGEEDARARRAEREFDRREEAAKEEFEDSDSEGEGEQSHLNGQANGQSEDRGKSREEIDQVIESFEKRLLELFLDGLDTIPYGPIDFADPAVTPANKLTAQDDEDRYFADEEEGSAPALNAQTAGDIRAPAGSAPVKAVSPAGDHPLADGEYDY